MSPNPMFPFLLRCAVAATTLLVAAVECPAQTPLRTAREVRELGNAAARQSRPPAQLRGTVTFCYHRAPRPFQFLYLQDDTGAVLVYLYDLKTVLEPGTIVDVSGTVNGGMFAPAVDGATARIVGTGPVPEPLRAPVAEFAAGGHFGHWIEVEGTVRDAVAAESELTLLLSAEGLHYRAVIPLPPQVSALESWRFLPRFLQPLRRLFSPEVFRLESWRGARVRLRGVNWTDNEVARGDPGSFRIMLPQAKWLTRLEREPGAEPVSVSGTVTARLADGSMTVLTPSGGVFARPLPLLPRGQPGAVGLFHQPMEPVKPGDEIILTGVRLSGQGTDEILDAEWRLEHRGTHPPAAVSAQMGELSAGKFDGRLVVIQGGFLKRTKKRVGWFQQELLTVDDDGRVLEVEGLSEPGTLFSSLTAGDRLRITGVAVRGPGAGGGVRILVRGSGDVVSLGNPSPWQNLLSWQWLTVFGAVLLLPLAWIILLRRRIAAQKKAAARQAEEEAAIRANESKLRLLFERSSDPMLLLDGKTLQFLDCNAAAQQIMRCENREELTCITPWDISPEFQPDGRSSADKARAVLDAVNKFGTSRFEWTHQRADGSQFPVEVVLTTVQLGSQPLVFVTWREISERLKMEGELRELNAELEVRVDERTAELRAANEKLQRSEQELHRNLVREKELNELKSAFVSMVSHEFRTPLGIIMSSSEILDRYFGRMSEDDRREHLLSITRNSRRMAAMMEEVLLLSRLDAGRMECRPAPLHLPGFCRRLVDEMHSATSRACPIHFSCDGSAADEAMADENLLRHVLSNLLGNAVKYSTPGAAVNFRLRRENGSAVIEVSDQGIGIPQADCGHLFEAFHRGTNVGQRRGTGLGLVIVKRCLDLHGGSVAVESTEGAGSTFTIRLPLWEGELSVES
jgi:PAS domain S-box-containing protein